MDSAEIKELVRNRYGSIAAASSSCCCPEQAKASRMGYTDEELQAVPDGANLGLDGGGATLSRWSGWPAPLPL
jgi:arsenite methyltransferase